jgi:hypothetical protein
MPFKSQAQRRFMFAKHPAIANRWAKKYDPPKNLPEKKAGASLAGLKKAAK